MDTHYIQITSSELADITKLLDNISLSMYSIVGKATSLRTRSQTVRCHGENLSSADKHRYMEADNFTLAKPHRIGVHEELLNKCVIARANGSSHLSEYNEGVGKHHWVGLPFQFYAGVVSAYKYILLI